MVLSNENYYDSTPLKKDYDLIINNKFSNEFELSILNDTISCFKIVEKLETDLDKHKLRLFKIFCGYSGTIFTNLKAKSTFINQNNQIGNYYVEKEAKEYEWEITTEKKTIESYTCYKAIGKEKIKNPAGTFVNIITVWFAPEIPVQIGPLGFSGLPGLILELNRKGVTFGATKILFENDISNKIDFPEKDKIISEEKLNNLRKKYLDD